MCWQIIHSVNKIYKADWAFRKWGEETRLKINPELTVLCLFNIYNMNVLSYNQSEDMLDCNSWVNSLFLHKKKKKTKHCSLSKKFLSWCKTLNIKQNIQLSISLFLFKCAHLVCELLHGMFTFICLLVSCFFTFQTYLVVLSLIRCKLLWSREKNNKYSNIHFR